MKDNCLYKHLLFILLCFNAGSAWAQNNPVNTAFSCDTAVSDFERKVDRDVTAIIAAGASECISLHEDNQGWALPYALVYWTDSKGRKKAWFYFVTGYENDGTLKYDKMDDFFIKSLNVDTLRSYSRRISAIPGDTISALSHDHLFRIRFFNRGNRETFLFCEKQWFTSSIDNRKNYFDRLIFYLRDSAQKLSAKRK